MATHRVLAVLDYAAGVYGRPFTAVSTAAATRSLQQEVNRPDDGNMMYHSPSDFALFELGEFDDVTGKYLLNPEPVLIVRASDLKS